VTRLGDGKYEEIAITLTLPGNVEQWGTYSVSAVW